MPSPFPFKRQLPITASTLIESIQKVQVETVEQYLRRFNALDYAKTLSNGGNPLPGQENKELRLPTENIAKSIQISAGDYAVYWTWQKAKIVYDVEPTLMRSLAEMDTTDILPGGVLSQLPHPNPVFVFTSGYPILHKDQMPGLLRAMYVTGRRADNTMCDTSDPEATQYQLTFNSDLVNDEGNVIDGDSVRISIHLTEHSFTIRSVIDKVLKDYAWEPLLGDHASEEQKRTYLETLAHFGVAHLLYVCSDKADSQRRPVGRKPPKKGQRPPRPLQLHQVGWRIGPTIKATREMIENDRRSQSGAGRTVTPHIRKAHLHTFKHGPGRTLSKVKWLPPIFVNSHGEQITIEGTIVPVQK
ncbi:hypothetical protein [Streptomyces sp. WZ-12]|uniref:hypothetical protein n=1 Tax=Streptomyces sp. WZ-12 TaxID=3030210 RepID=UPI00238154F1|nr:hypothetical protein [Streptomyces sp. WZ-12]